MSAKLEQIIADEAITSQHAQTSALCDKYQPTVYATDYLVDPEYTLESDILAKCERVTTLYDANGYVEHLLIRVRGVL